ncbi:MAG: RNA pseudouridine synthase, partial [Pseudomonadota bacterium]
SYRTLETGAGASPPGRASLVEVDLETGRRHQVRVQLAALGHPIVGDVTYGSLVEPRLDSIGLLSRSLTLVHPTQDHQVTFEAPPPPDWHWLPLDRLKL